MQFKVGDKVRLTREAITYKLIEQRTIKHSIVLWGDITDISDGDDMVMVDYVWYKVEDLELVTEESEFKRWEIVEVWHNAEGRRIKRIFICEAVWAKYPYICVDGSSEGKYLNWKPFLWAERNKIRKFKHKLTRKEIAEKFWVKEDFELVED